LRESFEIGVVLVWVVDPKARIVYAYRSLTDAREFKTTDTLIADEVLHGFNRPMAQLFEDRGWLTRD
jgi:Uma2 family endonuclease